MREHLFAGAIFTRGKMHTQQCTFEFQKITNFHCFAIQFCAYTFSLIENILKYFENILVYRVTLNTISVQNLTLMYFKLEKIKCLLKSKLMAACEKNI